MIAGISSIAWAPLDLDQTGPRSHLAIVNVIHGARDMDAYFAAHPEDDT